MEQFIKIEKWMTALGLSSSELIVFATIYGFSVSTEEHVCTASLDYLAEWAGVTRRQAVRIIQNLIERQLIAKENIRKNNTNRCLYKAITDHSDNITPCNESTVTKLHHDSVNMSLCDSDKITPCHSVNMSPNKIDSSRIEKKESSCSCSARVREDDNNDNNNDQSEYNISHNDGRKPRPMYRVNRTGIDESQLPYLDYVEWFSENHPKVRLYDNMGFFYKNGKQFRMSEYQTWPKILYEQIHLMFKGYSQVENYISGIAEAFGQDIERVKELFPIWCQRYGLDKVCYDIPDLYEKRDQYHGTTLNNAARAFFRQPAKERIPNITNA